MTLRSFLAVSGALVACACHGPTPATPATPATPGTPATPATPAPTPPALDNVADLPPAPRAVAASELTGDFACGPWTTKDFASADQELLGDRIRVRFFPNASPGGGHESGKLQVEKDGATLFVGAREMFLHGDEHFVRRAAKAGTFGGGYDTLSIPGRDGKLAIVTGVLRDIKADREMISIAHGWFLDPNRDVLDVAVFITTGAIEDLAQCRLFAEKIVSTVAQGPRMLKYGSGAEVETKVSYATFRYKPSADWILADSGGIHDFARMHFRKRGVFPTGYTELQLGLDSHPGDWKSSGEGEGDRGGKLFGLDVQWHLTGERGSKGAWTISTAVLNHDHAVAAIESGNAQDRDEAIRFAESIRVSH